MFIGIIKNITAFIANLNLTKKDVLGIIIVCLLIFAGLSANHYKSKANRLQVSIDLISSELRIEADDNIIDKNIEEIRRIIKALKEKDSELVGLYEELDDARKKPETKTEIMEELGEINDTKDICDMFADMGYPICSK